MGIGLGGLIAATEPPVEGDLRLVIHAWRWCGGWYPEHLPLYLGLHPHDDPLLLIDLLRDLRDALHATPQEQ